jgi:aminoglycoside phosphotransferase (APT) family kinase protein
VKLAEGGFNRTFLITMHGGFEMVVRIPYPVTVLKFYAIASEVATMRLLRSAGLPVPEVYDYSPSSDNAAKTEYIFMEFMRGTKLSNVWLELEEPDIVSILRQLTQLESRMMSIPFPAGGSLYYTKDLEKVAGRTGIPLNNESFCVGPDARLHMWYGRRSQLDVDRGPCMPLSAFSFVELSGTNRDYRRKRGGSAHSSSSQGTGVSGTVRSTATTVPA